MKRTYKSITPKGMIKCELPPVDISNEVGDLASQILLCSIPYDTFELLRSESADRKQTFDMPNAAIV